MRKCLNVKLFLILIGVLMASLAMSQSVAVAESIKIASFGSYSGPISKYGDAQTQGIELAIEDIEKAGGLLGKKIELVIADSTDKPAEAARILQRLVEKEKVNFVIGPISSAAAASVSDVVDPAKVVTVITVAGHMINVEEKCSRYIFKLSNDMEVFGKPFGEWVVKNLGKRIYVLSLDYAAGHQWSEFFREGVKKAGGEIIEIAYAPLRTPDFAPYFGKIRNANPEVLASFFAGADGINFVKQLDSFGLKEKLKVAAAGVLTTSDVLPAQGKSAEGIYTWFDSADAYESPEFKEFAKRVKDKYGVEIWFPHFRAYTAAKALLEAIKRAGSLDPDRVAAEIEAKPVSTPIGVISFYPGNHQAIMDYYVRQVREGKNVILETVKGLRGTDKCTKF